MRLIIASLGLACLCGSARAAPAPQRTRVAIEGCELSQRVERALSFAPGSASERPRQGVARRPELECTVRLSTRTGGRRG
jgi:hypothetical protein